MHSRSLVLLVLTGHLALAAGAQSVPSQHAQSGSGSAAASASQRLSPKYLNAPLRFEANQGQSSQEVAFLSHANRYNLYLTDERAVFQLKSRAKGSRPSDFSMAFLGSNRMAALAGVDLTRSETNYLIGNDPARWHTHVKNYAKVLSRDLYPGVDLTYYGNEGEIEYDLNVHPHASVKQIALDFEGLSDLGIGGEGDVRLTCGTEVVTLRKPHVYQTDARGKREEIAASWQRSGKHGLRFAIGRYNPDEELVIDPSFVFGTILGGSATDAGIGIALDAQGATYVTGSTTSTDFPHEPTSPPLPFQGTDPAGAGATAAFITKYNVAGTIVYSTYVGGATGVTVSGNTANTQGNAIAVTAGGAAIITGYSDANGSLPVTLGGNGCSGAPVNCAFSFLFELSANGSSEVFGEWIDGAGANAIALDGSGNIYLAGSTNGSATAFPTGVYQSTFGTGTTDAFVAKYSSAGAGTWWTYLGGNGNDVANGIALDATGNVYVAGETTANEAAPNSFPLKNPLSSTPGGEDAFVSELSNNGTQLLFSTYLGGSGSDSANAIAVSASGAIVVTGGTSSTDFPTTPGALQTVLCCTLTGPTLPTNAFVTEMAAGGASITYSGLLGGDGTTNGNGVVTDTNNNIYVVGTIGTDATQDTSGAPQGIFTIGDIDGNLLNLSSNSVQSQCDGSEVCQSAFILALPPQGNTILYFTYLGGETAEFGNAIAFDGASSCSTLAQPEGGPCVHVTGWTESSNFPVTDSTTLTGVQNAFVVQVPSIVPPTCTPTESYVGLTVTIAIECTANFVAGQGNINWGDSSSWTPVSLNGPDTAGTCTPSCSHTFTAGESGTASVTPTVSMTNTAGTGSTFATPFPVVQLGTLTVALALNPPNAGLTSIQEPASSVSVHATVSHASDTSIFSWSVNNVVGGNAAIGTITASGPADATYVPPTGITSPVAIAIVAIANADQTTASPALDLTVNPPITVALNPATVQPVQAGTGTIPVAAQVSKWASTANVTWALSGTGCSGAPCGSLTTAGPSAATVYNVPAALPSSATITDTLTATSAATGGGQATAQLAITVTALPITISIKPGSATVVAGQTTPVQFTATINGPSNKTVLWTLTGTGCNGGPCGTLSATGLYTAPAAPLANSPQTDTVTATSAADATQHVSAAVTINNPIAVTITSPTPPQFGIEAKAASMQQITAQVTGTTDTGMIWSLTGTGCAGAPCGTLSATGLYTAPASIAASAADTITVAAHADTTKTATIMAVVFPITPVPAPGSVSVAPGQTATYTITLPPGFGDPVNALQLSCANLPNGVTCTFNPNPLPPGTNSFTVTVATTAPVPVSAVKKGGGPVGVSAVLPFFGLLLFGFRRSRKRLERLMLLALSTLLVFGAASCGTSGSFGSNQQVSLQATPPGVYTISVIATPVVSTTSSTSPGAFTVTTLPLTVQ